MNEYREIPLEPAAHPEPRMERRSEDYEDGCRLHNHCLTCPFPICYMDPGGSMALMTNLKRELERMAVVRAENLDDHQAAERFNLDYNAWRRRKRFYFKHYPEELPAENQRLEELAKTRGAYDLPHADQRPDYDPKNLRQERCIAPIETKGYHRTVQCHRYRGFGPKDQYCRVHARTLFGLLF